MNKEFLEEYSLFRKFNLDVPKIMDNIPKPPINMVCRNCGDNQTFNMINEYYEFNHYMNVPSAAILGLKNI